MGLFAANPLTSHNFMVFIGPFPIAFSKIKNMQISMDTETIIEGGQNHFVHSLSSPAKSEKTLVLERGVPQGGMALTSQLLRVGLLYKDVIILVMDHRRVPKKVYVMTGAVIKSRSFSELDANGGGILIENMEIIFRTLTELVGIDLLLSFI